MGESSELPFCAPILLYYIYFSRFLVTENGALAQKLRTRVRVQRAQRAQRRIVFEGSHRFKRYACSCARLVYLTRGTRCLQVDAGNAQAERVACPTRG